MMTKNFGWAVFKLSKGFAKKISPEFNNKFAAQEWAKSEKGENNVVAKPRVKVNLGGVIPEYRLLFK